MAPWTIDGVVAVAAERGLTAHHWTASAPGGIAAPRLAARGVPAAAPQPTTSLRAPGPRRPLRVPSTWFGAHAVLLAPCIDQPDLGRGPVARALATVANACTTESLHDPVATGRWLVEHVFAGTGVIVDASWATTLGRKGPTLSAVGQLYAADAFDAEPLDNQLRRDLFATASRTRSLSDRHIGGLWQSRPHDIHVPGPLARTWHSYREGTP